MKPKEKAQDLWVKYYKRLPDSIYSNYAAKMEAKYFALIAVNEILDNMMLYQENFDAGKPVHHKSYWESVKKEIEKI